MNRGTGVICNLISQLFCVIDEGVGTGSDTHNYSYKSLFSQIIFFHVPIPAKVVVEKDFQFLNSGAFPKKV